MTTPYLLWLALIDRFGLRLGETIQVVRLMLGGFLAAFGDRAGRSSGHQETLGQEVDPGTAIHLMRWTPHASGTKVPYAGRHRLTYDKGGPP